MGGSNSTSTANDNSPGLRATLGFGDAAAILVGITIGAGIYSTPQLIAEYQESFQNIILLWVLAGGFVFLGGLIYAELGSRLPHTGGEYVYLNRAFGPYVGFVFGWAQLFIIRTSPAAGLAIVTVDYLKHFIDLPPMIETGVAIAIILLIGTINYVGIRQASIYQIFSTLVKVFGLFALVIAGLILVQGQQNLLSERLPSESDLSPFGRFAATMMLIVFSFLGWDRVGYAAGEMKNPRRAIPASMFWGLGTVLVVYVLANFLYHYVLGMQEVRGAERVASLTATRLFGQGGAALVAVIVMISATGSINGTMMTAPRVYYAMSKDRLFFSWFNYVHPTFRTPSRAILAHCGWAIVILLVRANFENIVAGMTFAVLIFYVFTTLALFKLRRDQVGEKQIFKTPTLAAIVFLVGILALIGLRGFYEWQKSVVDLAFIATGIPFAIYFVRTHGSSSGD